MLSPFAYSAKLEVCESKHLALYLAIREAITEGRLSPEERLPSTRQLAALYGLSRGSVSVAYEMLTAEGFVHAGVGKGTFVSGWGPEEIAINGSPLDEKSEMLASPELTVWGRRLMELRSIDQPTNAQPFSFIPEGVGTQWFPWMEWKAEVALQWKKFGASWKNEAHSTEGSVLLRQAIASRLRRERGIACEAEDIVITVGSMQAIVLITQLLLEEGKTAVIENPSYTGIQRAVKATGAAILAQKVDENGIVPQDWPAQLLFVTPTRQFPTGVVLSYERRRALLSWASRRNAWIVEDDYDSDFRWGGRPIEPLKSLDREGRVIYVGTFSRSMCVGVRIGYAVVPRELVQPFIHAKQLYDPHPSGIAEQQALAAWMSEGGYDRHIRRMRRVYGKLGEQLRLSLERNLGSLFEVFPSDAGLHVYVKWKKSPEEYNLLVRECASRGISWREGAVYAVHQQEQKTKQGTEQQMKQGTKQEMKQGTKQEMKQGTKPPAPSALFGFAHLDEEQLEIGVNLIVQAAQTVGLIDSKRGQGGNIHA
jgi:GntR family transcriptional regulator/MocR family aminotransferase